MIIFQYISIIDWSLHVIANCYLMWFHVFILYWPGAGVKSWNRTVSHVMHILGLKPLSQTISVMKDNSVC